MLISRLRDNGHRLILVFGMLTLLLSGLLGYLSFESVDYSTAQSCFVNGGTSNSQLNSTSTDSNDNAAVRWDCRWRSNSAVRQNSRQHLRSFTFPYTFPENSGVMPENTLRWNQIVYPTGYNEVKFTYYRRLWQRVLPMRAGPTA